MRSLYSIISCIVLNLILYEVRVETSGGAGSTATQSYREFVEQEVKLNVYNIIESHGYIASEYGVLTEDDYILKIHRIKNPLVTLDPDNSLKPVLLMHGLMGSAADWVVNSDGVRPKLHDDSDSLKDFSKMTTNSLAFTLSNNRYDVWLGTVRGSYYGQGHNHLTKDDPTFWEFSFDEHIRYDLPAIIEFIQQQTLNSKLGYVGFSHGSLIGFGLLSEQPDYADILKPFVALSPLAYLRTMKSSWLNHDFSESIVNLRNSNQDALSNPLAMKYLKFLACKLDFIHRSACQNFLYLLFGFNANKISKNSYHEYIPFLPASTSTKTIAQYGQAIKNRRFVRFDYGDSNKNYEKFGVSERSDYNIDNIRSKSIFLVYSDNDWLSRPKDINRLMSQLKVPFKQHRISHPKWEHFDYLFSSSSGKVVNTKVLEIFNNFDKMTEGSSSSSSYGIKMAVDDLVTLDVVKVIESRGYKAEQHDVKTADGYILTIQRVINPLIESEEDRKKLKPVLLMHGIMSTALDWVINSEDAEPKLVKDCPLTAQTLSDSLAFTLSNNMYDVWLGTMRGSAYGQKHVSLTIKDPEFWNFSHDEQILLDLPAIISHIQQVTEHKKIGYVGFSHGSLMIFGLLADKSEYATIIEPIIALAPIGYVDGSENMVEISKQVSVLQEMNSGAVGSRKTIEFLKILVCGSESIYKSVCDNLLFMIFGFNAKKLDKSLFAEYLRRLPAATSVKAIAHYGQSMKCHRFRHFDHGETKNIEKYSKSTSPGYNLTYIRSPHIFFFHSDGDMLSSPKEVSLMKSFLKVPYHVRYITKTHPDWNHFDYIFSEISDDVINTKVLEAMNDYTRL